VKRGQGLGMGKKRQGREKEEGGREGGAWGGEERREGEWRG